MTAPLTPPECDLRGLTFMPLDVLRLRDSDLANIETSDVFKASVLLWCAAWHQAPAGSLPGDDRVLARMSGLDLKAWAKARDAVLGEWVRCDDGRLYHPVVAEKAREAWIERQKYRQRREQDKERLKNWRERAASRNDHETHDETPRETRSETHAETRFETRKTEKGQRRDSEENPKPNGLGETRDGASTSRGARLPPDWQPSDIDRAYAARQGFTPAAVERVAEKFRNYWRAKTGKSATKVDWPATWRNWVLEEAERRGIARPTGQREVDWC